MVSLLALVAPACGSDKTDTGEATSRSFEIKRNLKTDLRKTTGLATAPSEATRPALVLKGTPPAILDPMRGVLEKSTLAPKGRVAVDVQLDPEIPKATGVLNVRLTIAVGFLHAPNMSEATATIAGTLEHTNTTPEQLGAELGDVVDDFLASLKLPANVGPGTPVAKAVAITAGRNNCTLHEDRTVRCWSLDVQHPTEIPSIAGTTQISSAENYGTCGLRENGNVYCIDAWDNSVGLAARDVCSVDAAKAVSTGDNGACALIVDGTVRCWGTDKRFFVPCDKPAARQVKGVTDAVSLRVGTFDACASKADGTVLCWKMDKALTATPKKHLAKSTHLLPEFELCGVHGTTVTCENPTTKVVHKTTLPEAPTKLVRASQQLCALVPSGQIYCWGRYADGNKTAGTLAAYRDIVDVDASLSNLCTLDRAGVVQCASIRNPSDKLTDKPKTITF